MLLVHSCLLFLVALLSMVLVRDYHFFIPVPNSGRLIGYLLLCLPFGILMSGKKLWRGDKVGFLLFHGVLAFFIMVLLAGAEIYGRQVLPPWPASALHGHQPHIGKDAWGRIQNLYPEAQGNNSWGQRDIEHTSKPAAGIVRIAFVGDSYLEESTITPLPRRVGEELGTGFETINLGVTGTAPNSYFWRIKNVALKLAPSHIICFIYVGNDLIGIDPDRESSLLRLKNFILAPLPQSSLMGAAFPGLNHLLTNPHDSAVSPSYQSEESTRARLLTKGLSHLAEGIAELHGQADERPLIVSHLRAHNLQRFYDELANPDMGMFRSYLFDYALGALVAHNRRRIADEQSREENEIPQQNLATTYKWLAKINEVCREAGVGLTYAIIPSAFEVDDRMVDIWAPFGNFRQLSQNRTIAAGLLKQKMKSDKLSYIDLYPVFTSQRGTYLNFDGHWSTRGNELASIAVTQYLKNIYPNN